jgi:RNA polymerase sigma-70 factor (ECF subfamily)
MAENRRRDTSERPSGPFAPPANGRLASSLYQVLRKLAAHKMRLERVNYTLKPTALVHEAFLKFAEASGSAWQDREHFLAVAARVMHHVLVGHACSHGADERAAGSLQVAFNEKLLSGKGPITDVLIIDEALTRLAESDARQAEILKLHFFSDMTFEEIGGALGISCRTVKRDWSMARAWLRGELSRRK